MTKVNRKFAINKNYIVIRTTSSILKYGCSKKIFYKTLNVVSKTMNA